MEKLLLKPDEVVQMLGVGRSQVYRMLRSGELPVVKIGASVRVPVAGLKVWLIERGISIPSGIFESGVVGLQDK